MHIIQITPSYAPNLGGVETHVLELTKELLRLGHQVTIITLQKNSSTNQSSSRSGQITQGDYQPKVICLPVTSSLDKLPIWQAIYQLREIISSADVVQVHDVFWWILPLWPQLRKKIYTTFHGWEGIYPVSISAKLQRWLWSKMSVRTMHIGRWIQEFYLDYPDVVSYGAPPNLIRKLRQATSTSKLHLPLNIVFVGRLVSENEVAEYLIACQQLHKQGLNFNMTWVGDGLLRTECAQIGRVTGMVADVERYVSGADLVFANSYLSMLQVQAAGVVVCSVYSHMLKQRYLETYPGFESLLMAESGKDLAEQVLQLVKQPARLQRLRRNGQTSAAKHTWTSVTKQYLNLWRQQ